MSFRLTSLFDLTGRTALVTGGNSGIEVVPQALPLHYTFATGCFKPATVGQAGSHQVSTGVPRSTLEPGAYLFILMSLVRA